MNAKNLFFLLLMTALIGVSLSTVFIVDVSAQPATAPVSDCDQLQLVLLVDQSGSMFGFFDEDGDFIPPTDPNDIRYEAGQRAAEYMGYRSWSSRRDLDLQLSIVYFGDDPQAIMSWESISPAEEAENVARQRELAGYFAPLDDSYGNTQPRRAFETAASLFANVAEPVDGCPKRGVVMITDGKPASGTGGFDAVAHLNQIENYVTQFMPAPEHQIYVLGLDQTNTHFEQYRSEWEDIAGDPERVKRIATTSAMRGEINRIINELLGTVDQCVDGETFIVPPYVQRLEIDFTKENLSKTLSITDAEGRMDDAIPGYDFSQPERFVDKVVIRNPIPGQWRLNTPLTEIELENCQVFVQRLFAVETVTEPTDGLQLPQYAELPINFEILDQDGNSLPEYDNTDFDFSTQVKLITEDGDEQILTTVANPSDPYETDIVVRNVGENQLVVRPTGTRQGQEYYLYNQTVVTGTGLLEGEKRLATISVEPIELYVDQTVPTRQLQYESFPFAIALRSPSFEPIDTAQDYALVDFKIEVEEPDGNVTTAIGRLTPDFTYASEIDTDQAGEYIIRYSADILDGPEPLETFGPVEVRLVVEEVAEVSAAIISPNATVATGIFGPFGSGTGVDFEIQLQKTTATGVAPVGAGEVFKDLQNAFDVMVTDADGNDISDEVRWVSGDQTGSFRLDNQLGRGAYNVVVTSDAPLNDNYRWATPIEIDETVRGTLNPLFYAVVAAFLLLLLLLAFALYRFVALFRNPLSGRLVILQRDTTIDGDPHVRTLWSGTLPKRNRARLYPKIRTAGIAGTIRSIRVMTDETMAGVGRARVEVKLPGGQSRKQILEPGGPGVLFGGGIELVKDPSPQARRTSSDQYSDTFDGGTGEQGSQERDYGRSF